MYYHDGHFGLLNDRAPAPLSSSRSHEHDANVAQVLCMKRFLEFYARQKNVRKKSAEIRPMEMKIQVK